VSGGEAAVETTVEADLKDDPCRLRRRQRTIGVGQVERHRLLAEDRLFRQRPPRRSDPHVPSDEAAMTTAGISGSLINSIGSVKARAP
jgi:hypothetical protein